MMKKKKKKKKKKKNQACTKVFRAGLGFLFTFFLSSIFTTVQVVFIVAKIALIFISLSAVHIDDFI